MIERYIYAVGKRLSKSVRADIEKELRSLIGDMLEERTQGKEASEEDISEILKEIGEPSQVAMRYSRGKNYLIGPELLPVYFNVLTILLIIVGCARLIEFAVDVTIAKEAFFITLGNFFPSLLSSMIGVVGSMTIVFYLIERFSPNLKFGTFDPRKLPEIPEKKDRIKPIGVIAEIVFMVVFLLFLNTYCRNVPMFEININGVKGLYNIFSSEALNVYIPLWSILLAITILLRLYMLKIGRYNVLSRVVEIVINILNIGIAWYMINGPVLISDTLAKVPVTNDKLANLYEVTVLGYQTSLKLIIVIMAIGTAVNVFKLVKNMVRQ